MNPETDPRDIDLKSPTSPLTITWEDGHRSEYPLELLRRYCPCAICTKHGATPLVERMSSTIPPHGSEVRSVRETGNYALLITWGDGHDTGYYAFAHLRAICPCEQCTR